MESHLRQTNTIHVELSLGTKLGCLCNMLQHNNATKLWPQRIWQNALNLYPYWTLSATTLYESLHQNWKKCSCNIYKLKSNTGTSNNKFDPTQPLTSNFLCTFTYSLKHGCQNKRGTNASVSLHYQPLTWLLIPEISPKCYTIRTRTSITIARQLVSLFLQLLASSYYWDTDYDILKLRYRALNNTCYSNSSVFEYSKN